MDTPEQSPQERYDAAIAAFQTEQSLLPPGVRDVALPDVGPAAAINALITLLVGKGLITQQEWLDEQTLHRALLVEDLVRQLRAVKRQHSGLVMPGTRSA